MAPGSEFFLDERINSFEIFPFAPEFSADDGMIRKSSSSKNVNTVDPGSGVLV